MEDAIDHFQLNISAALEFDDILSEAQNNSDVPNDLNVTIR